MFRIRTRLVAAFVLVIALPAIPLSLVVNNLLDRSLNPALQDELKLGLEVGLEASRASLEEAKLRFVQIAENLPPEELAGKSLVMLDSEGLVEAAADLPEFLHQDLPGPGADPVRLEGHLFLQKYFHDQSGSETVVLVQALPADLVEGAATITRSLSLLRALQLDRSDILRSFVLSFALVYGLLILMAVAVAFLVAGRLARPIEALSAGTRQVAAGDLDTRIDVDSKGEVGALVTAFNDMVARLAEQRTTMARLEKLAAWRGLSRVLAHEIKNPLTPIQLAVQEARQSVDRDDPRAREIMADCETIVLEEVAGLRNLVAGFSNFARMPEPRPVLDDFRPLADDLARLYGSRLRCDLPEGSLPAMIDAAELRRALINLIDNGLNASELAGSKEPVVLTGEPRPDGGFTIGISDQGVGIPSSSLDHIFEPDFSTNKEGMGLGLPVVKGIVEGHGGTIKVASVPSEGTRFTLQFPGTKEGPCPAS